MIDALYTDDTFEPVSEDVQLDDPLVARRLLIEYQRNERKASELAQTMNAVIEPYRERIEKLDARNRDLREMLLRFCQANGSVSFPDVGGAHVAKRKPAPKLIDAEAALAWWQHHRPHEIETSHRIPAQSLKTVLAELGELPPGVELVESDPSVTIKGAA